MLVDWLGLCGASHKIFSASAMMKSRSRDCGGIFAAVMYFPIFFSDGIPIGWNLSPVFLVLATRGRISLS